MSDNLVIIENKTPELLIDNKSQSGGQSLVREMMQWHLIKTIKLKDQIDGMAAEVTRRQDCMHFINDLIGEINTLINDQNDPKFELDVSSIKDRLKTAKELGVKINDEKTHYTAIERDRFLESLHLATDNWDKQNRTKIQKMDILVKQLDRVLMLVKEFQKNEDRSKKTCISAISGR